MNLLPPSSAKTRVAISYPAGFEKMGLLQVANWRNPGWLTEKQLKCCQDLFDGIDPAFGNDEFREFLAEELCSYMAREYAKKIPEIEDLKCTSEAHKFFRKLTLVRNAVYTLHTAFN